MSAPLPVDKAAAFKGLLITTALLAVVVLSIVKLTNMKFADHKPAAAAAEH